MRSANQIICLEEAEKVGTVNEPNLHDIQTLLISIQRTTENILKENNKLSNEVGELKSSLRRLESELLATKVVLNDVKNTNKELRIELDAAKRKISQQRDEIDEQYHGLDDLEQYSRKNSLEIVGIPESIRENESAVLKIANALNVQVKPEDIDICHRVKRKRSSPIITGRKNGFTRVTKLKQKCSKYHICTNLLKSAREQRSILH